MRGLLVALAMGIAALAATAPASARVADKPPLTRETAKFLIAGVQESLTYERKAREDLIANTPASLSQALDDVRGADSGIATALHHLETSSFDGASPIPTLKQIQHADDAVEEGLRTYVSEHYGQPLPTTKRDAWVSELGSAITLKKHALALLNGVLVLTDPTPTTGGKQCTVEKPFQVFAIPAGYSGSYADVYPHGIPKGAKNVKYDCP